MDYLEKTPRKTKVTTVKYLGICLLVIFGAVLLSVAGSEYQRYKQVLPHAVTVEGIITSVEIEKNAESSDDYKMYMTFSYEGKKYTIHYDTSGKSSSMNRVGEQVSVKINPMNPSEKISVLKSNCATSGIVGIILLMLGMSMLRINERENYVAIYGLRKETIKKDIIAKIQGKMLWKFLLTTGAGFIAVTLYMSMVMPSFLFIIGGAALVLGMILWQDCRKKLNAAREELFQIKQVSVIQKEESRDSEGDPVYYLVYIDYTLGKNRHKVSRKKYNSAKIGDCLIVVYLTNPRNPFLVYHGTEFDQI